MKVVSKRIISKLINVYCIEVDNENHNFVIENNIVVSNCGPVCHAGTQATGSPNVIINGMAVARVGDSIDCGSSNATGSGNVMVN